MKERTSSFAIRGGSLRIAVAVAALLALAGTGHAEEAAKIDTGDTAWMLTSSALVLMMTAAGLALESADCHDATYAVLLFQTTTRRLPVSAMTTYSLPP